MNGVQSHPSIDDAIEASRKGDIPRLDAWLRGGSNPNTHDLSGWTPLLWASARGHDEAVTLLLDNKFTKASLELPHRESGALAIHMQGIQGAFGQQKLFSITGRII